VECTDADCVQYGYKFGPTAPECNMTICSIYNDILADSEGKALLTDFVYNQDCGQSRQECPDLNSTNDPRCPLYKPPGTGGSGSQDGDDDTLSSKERDYTPYYIGGGILGSLLLVGIAIMARRK
jgi:hypothetical protein